MTMPAENVTEEERKRIAAEKLQKHRDRVKAAIERKRDQVAP